MFLFPDTRVWDIIEECIGIVLTPDIPDNPFKISFEKLSQLPEIEQVLFMFYFMSFLFCFIQQALTAGSLIQFLRKIYLKNPPFHAKSKS